MSWSFPPVPEKSELELFRCPKDYHNVKAALKAEFLGLDPESYMMEGGNFEPMAMASMIRERNFMVLLYRDEGCRQPGSRAFR